MQHRPFFLSVFASLALSFAGCGGDPPPTRTCSASSDCGRGQVCVDGLCRAGVDGGEDPGLDAGPRPDAHTARLTGIRIEPATASLVSVNGAMPTVDLEIVATYDDG